MLPLPRARQSASILLEYYPVDIEIDEGLDPCFENFEKSLPLYLNGSTWL